jgi:hypothetical protein
LSQNKFHKFVGLVFAAVPPDVRRWLCLAVDVLKFFEAVPLMPEAQPQNQEKADRKGIAFSHIGRHSREENYFSRCLEHNG